MEEPIHSKKEKKINEKEIRKMEKILLEKHFEGRKYEEDKIKKWSDTIIEEMNEYLLTNYSSYGFSIFLFVEDQYRIILLGKLFLILIMIQV